MGWAWFLLRRGLSWAWFLKEWKAEVEKVKSGLIEEKVKKVRAWSLKRAQKKRKSRPIAESKNGC